ncbi:DUF1824 family protein [Pseudanabaena sp. PCC 6802]|uniref:DUF1824 family protein n=1 Tax=Pseudanabaena sp. PCC 6802 TaxID=118173 RepID=UPI00034C7273|nr:DUF1824 family protein [Pseudanabaena sp. PCC 6802]
MSPIDRDELTISDAHDILVALSDLGNKPVCSEEQKESLRKALLFLKAHTDYQIFGVCADSLVQGTTALEEYAQAFAYNLPPIDSDRDGSVYIKFNPNRNLFHASSYSGEYKGVLVSYQSDYSDGHNATYGHFPLDLFNVKNSSV